MKAIAFTITMLAMLAVGAIQSAFALKVGLAAPDFTLEDTNGDRVTLRQFRSQKIVLIEFIGAVFAPICTANVQQRGIDYDKFKGLNVQVIGISADSRFALKAFSDSIQAPFPLLSDRHLQAIRSYGVLAPDKVRSLRAYFLVDEKGILRQQWLLGPAGDDIVFSSDPILVAIQELAAKH